LKAKSYKTFSKVISKQSRSSLWSSKKSRNNIELTHFECSIIKINRLTKTTMHKGKKYKQTEATPQWFIIKKIPKRAKKITYGKQRAMDLMLVVRINRIFFPYKHRHWCRSHKAALRRFKATQKW